jgi:hypothetical protein
MSNKASMGHFPGLAPLGYMNTKSSIKGMNKILPDTKRWATMRTLFDLFLTGSYSVAELRHTVNAKYGLRTRKSNVRGNSPLSKNGIYRILNDPFYYGYFRYRGKLYKGLHKPMLSIEEFERLQAILHSNSRQRYKKHEFAFTGFMKCGSCGASITATLKTKKLQSTGRMKSYCFYHCTKRLKVACSASAYVREADMETMVASELSKYDIHPELAQWAIKIIQENKQDEEEKNSAIVHEQELAETRIEKELNHLIEMRLSGDLTPEKYREIHERKQNDLQTIRARKDFHIEQQKAISLNIKEDIHFLTEVVKRFKKADVKAQKTVCQKFGGNWLVSDGKLIIDKQLRFYPFKNFLDSVYRVFRGFEPRKTIMDIGQNAFLGMLRPIVWTLESEVRDHSGTSPPDR